MLAMGKRNAGVAASVAPVEFGLGVVECVTTTIEQPAKVQWFRAEDSHSASRSYFEVIYRESDTYL